MNRFEQWGLSFAREGGHDFLFGDSPLRYQII